MKGAKLLSNQRTLVAVFQRECDRLRCPGRALIAGITPGCTKRLIGGEHLYIAQNGPRPLPLVSILVRR